jgi:tetratricopeptide (TPR) repeat protein
MTKHDWYRNTTWNEEIEARFFDKLRRARGKEQYLRIQAGALATSYPAVALRLLDEYFKLKDDFDHAQAYVDRARAYLAQGNLPQAIQSYEAALAREEKFPNRETYAYLEYPFLVAVQRLEDYYERSVEILGRFHSRLTFPVDHFRWHAAAALILVALGNLTEARQHAARALAAADEVTSGFRYHPKLGLVEDKYESVRAQLRELIST